MTARRLGIPLVILAGLIALETLLLFLAPAERTLGQTIKWVYLHGALIRSCLFGFVAAGVLGLAWLALRNADLMSWLVAMQRATVALWVVYLLSSMWVTYLAWGEPIAWGEPRVSASLRITLAVSLVTLITEWARKPTLIAIANLVLASAVVFSTGRAGVIRHPIDPIGASESMAIQGFYGAILATTIAMLLAMAATLRRVPR